MGDKLVRKSVLPICCIFQTFKAQVLLESAVEYRGYGIHKHYSTLIRKTKSALVIAACHNLTLHSFLHSVALYSQHSTTKFGEQKCQFPQYIYKDCIALSTCH